MSVFKKNGNWFVRYRDIEGKQREKKAGAMKSLAIELERKLLADRNYQKNFGYIKKKEITFSEWAKEYLNRLKSRVKEVTVINNTYNLKRMELIFGDKLLSQLTEKDFWDYVKTTKGGIAGKTVKKYSIFFLGVLNEAKECNYNVATIKLKVTKRNNARVRYLTEEEAETLLKNSGTLKLLITMALTTGMRKMEMLNLTWQNIDLKAKLIHIEESKNGERRSVPINKTLLAMLEPKESGRRVFEDLRNVNERFVKAVKKSNITNFRFHDLRHTFASWLAIKGVSLYTIKELLGHKSIQMTQRYAHLSPDVRFSAVDLIKL